MAFSEVGMEESVNLMLLENAMEDTVTPRLRRCSIRPNNYEVVDEDATVYGTTAVAADHNESSAREEGFVDDERAKTCAREQAEEVQRSLDPKHPSFVKTLVKSHVRKVSGGLWLWFHRQRPPKNFCNLHLPKEDVMITLVDESGETCPVKYGGTGFTTGWKSFSNTHNLAEGDALVFQLVKPAEFQVHIIRAYTSFRVNGGFTSQNLEAGTEQITPRAFASAIVRSDTIDRAEALEGSFINPALQSHTTDQFLLVAADHAEKSTRAKTCARERAKEVQQSLDPEHPSFVKSMVRSHVSGGFWLGLPAQFCDLYLPKNDVMVTLVDEKDEECQVKFKSGGFSAGWTGFSTAHNLIEGDALVFQLVKDAKFQVYIIRAYDSSGVDGAIGLQNSEACVKQTAPRKRVRRSKTIDPKQSSTLLLSSNHLSISGREGNGDTGLATFRGWENHDRKSFDVAIDGLRRNSKLSEHTWTKYYELCRSQNAFLHENLLKRHHKLVVGIIAETVIIANGIKASKISTFADDFATWDQSLEGFGHLGMNVGFLRAKLNRLQSLVSISEEELYLKRREEAEVEHAHMEEEIKRLELEILELKEASKMLDAEVNNLKIKSGNRELKFQEEVDSPW
ncbi:hypothetical protein GIB67_023444 [Kingdonia uniflora]|uniref:TF-B3 domain-containing protein n=1 Tax=Kingdonia uniflora TaxID=39325 RepID=A0A7J7P9X6_9MAGN|nr:hypothetical protein GIB67_023444 [Kingdonia uniflora]